MINHYICDKESWYRHAANFSESHWHPLADGRIVVVVNARENFHDLFADEENVLPMPHLMTPDRVGEEAAKALSEHGVSPDDTVLQATKKIAKTNPMFRPERHL